MVRSGGTCEQSRTAPVRGDQVGTTDLPEASTILGAGSGAPPPCSAPSLPLLLVSVSTEGRLDDTRIAAALFVAAHGIGYTIWFMSAWTPATLGEREKAVALFNAPASAGAGKTVGVLALLVVAGFLAAAFGIWQQTAWWPAALVAIIVAAVPIGLLWNPVGTSAP